MKCILISGNVSYTKGEFSKFMKEFGDFSVDGNKIVDACCGFIYRELIIQLKNENIVVAGKNRNISKEINNAIVNDNKFFEYFTSDISLKIADILLKRSVTFIQIFGIINNRIIKTNVNGCEYIIADTEVIKQKCLGGEYFEAKKKYKNKS